ncbi:phosphoadenylyl-sulfate reductase [Longimicrobium sp.]|uniref:phosphoadenylyl-sulfate reductase n=1 Tax=Longimicrobium sp. TaxID=2029185 RepID=UPI002B59C9AB|nr:phosphoadenylyl-sulfate reductase [Longimicrobium sp.]HSU12618.1 phosphoadenylyl-sulfate reductase [Longimicrobium sp.]
MSALALPQVDEALECASAERVLRWALDAFAPGRLGVVSAFGPGSIVLIDLLHAIGADLPVVFIDTLHHFPETLDLVERVRERYDLDLRVYRPADTIEAFEAQYGPRLWERDLERYQQVAKVEPFQRATEGLDGWITGRRRDQAHTRSVLPVVERGERVRVNPLASWNRAEVWGYIVRNRLPYNALHDQGYASIGDAPLTTPTASGEDERAGRWRGHAKTECGIHVASP